MTVVLAKRLAIFALIWLVMSRADPSGLIFGAVAAGAATWTSIVLLPPGERRVDLLAVLRLAPGFALRSVSGGIDVARRALSPRMPLRPGWIAYATALPPGAARVSFGSEMSLLPGSLVAGGRGDMIYVHCLDAGQDVAGQFRAEEKRIAMTLRQAKPGRAPRGTTGA